MTIKITSILILIIILSGCIGRQDKQYLNISTNNTIPNIDTFENTSVTELAKKDAIERFNLSEDNIKIISIIPVEWTDTSLGYPEPGKEIGRDYPLETIQGYVIIISANGKLYEYHSDYHRIIPPKNYIENIIPTIINNSIGKDKKK